MMAARHREATPRRRSGVATIELPGELPGELHVDIEIFGEDVLDSADAESATDLH